MYSELIEIYSEEYVQKKIDKYGDLEDKITISQEYRVANRETKRAMLRDVEKSLWKWERIMMAHKRAKNKRLRRGPTISSIGYRP